MILKLLNKNIFSLRPLVVICLSIAFVLAALMALNSGFDHHPDELHHFLAARYYTHHFLPPIIGDPAVRETYSVWGVSYLNFQWVEYFLAGKFMLLLSPFVDQQTAARCFQLFLFAAIGTFLTLRSKYAFESLVLASFLLITPQVWYIFSYVNNDACGLVVAFLIAYEFAIKDSLLERFLSGKQLTGGLIFGLLIGILLICKTNYLSFILFATFWLLARFGLNSILLRKYALIAIVAVLVLSFRVGLDLYVNGETNLVGASYINYLTGHMSYSGTKLAAYQDEIADPKYRPSVVESNPAGTPPDVKMAAKGVPFLEIFSKWKWHRLSFRSFTGCYGYMTIFGPGTYYTLMWVIYILFGIYVTIVLLRSRDQQVIIQLIITGTFAITCILSSAYLSWTYAFQAQGRYLFPILPMIATLVATNPKLFNEKILFVLLLAAFAASVYSFVFVGWAAMG
jgi:hypothetical protein